MFLQLFCLNSSLWSKSMSHVGTADDGVRASGMIYSWKLAGETQSECISLWRTQNRESRCRTRSVNSGDERDGEWRRGQWSAMLLLQHVKTSLMSKLLLILCWWRFSEDTPGQTRPRRPDSGRCRALRSWQLESFLKMTHTSVLTKAPFWLN